MRHARSTPKLPTRDPHPRDGGPTRKRNTFAGDTVCRDAPPAKSCTFVRLARSDPAGRPGPEMSRRMANPGYPQEAPFPSVPGKAASIRRQDDFRPSVAPRSPQPMWTILPSAIGLKRGAIRKQQTLTVPLARDLAWDGQSVARDLRVPGYAGQGLAQYQRPG